ncbi:5'-nucleotidase family protein [Desulfamplus magnetovallimortis]|uniref:5'-nucleotidase family protein n=1 Tax=Desulfamplus magnetovallimortis TaxID=1246637 RepID=A0A1W1HGJ4_9BACT|nr:5'-nucleotidase [Desulfamplus magnetovallimortis]SLM31502.1 5'-nucleotidase family protein [Desulfamplus magnetovallimortis]
MPLDLSDTFVVGISATALFDLSEIDRVFRETSRLNPDNAIEVYRKQMMATEEQPLAAGTGYPLVKALLNLNRYQVENQPPLVEVVVMSRNSPDSGICVLNSIRHHKLAISRSAFTAGESVVDYLDAFDVDLFLTTNAEDAQKVIDSRACAAAVVTPPPEQIDGMETDQVRIAFDGDAVLFDESSEIVYKTKGLSEFQKDEDEKQNIPLEEGPYATLLKKLSRLQDRLPIRMEFSPVRIALVTARSSPAEMRVIKTLRHWGVYIDEAFFLGGVGKDKVLKAFRPHIFFDDKIIHLDAASKIVPSGRVLYRSESILSRPDEAAM